MWQRISEISNFTLLNALITITSIILSLTLAYALGPSEYGKYASYHAITLIILPLFSLKVETRIAKCKDENDLNIILNAVYTISILMLFTFTIVISILQLFKSSITLYFCGLLALFAIQIESKLQAAAYLGSMRLVLKLRALKVLAPISLSLLTALFYPVAEVLIIISSIGVTLSILLLNYIHERCQYLQFEDLLTFLRENLSGVSAALSLGILNSIVNNGIVVFLSVQGYSKTAGHFALMQRLINTPLSVFGSTAQSFLLKRTSVLHKSKKVILLLFILLFSIAVTLAGSWYLMLYIQDFIEIPSDWVIEKYLFISTMIFFSLSFSIGSLSIISIRLIDEWFVVYWQAILLVMWSIVFFGMKDLSSFYNMLIVSGLLYFILLFRWVRLIE